MLSVDPPRSGLTKHLCVKSFASLDVDSRLIDSFLRPFIILVQKSFKGSLDYCISRELLEKLFFMKVLASDQTETAQKST